MVIHPCQSAPGLSFPHGYLCLTSAEPYFVLGVYESVHRILEVARMQEAKLAWPKPELLFLSVHYSAVMVWSFSKNG